MNREIKFRAWDTVKNENFKRPVMYDWNYLRTWEFKHIQQQGVFLMQYTGLKDKNGKEIYEGDVLLHNNNKRFVGFKQAQFVLIQKNGTECKDWWSWSKHSEVIGNIYENHELI